MIGSVGWIGRHVRGGPQRVGWAWEYFAFLANSFVFILIGMNVASKTIDCSASTAAGIAVLLVLAGRALSIYQPGGSLLRSRLALPATYQHTLFWGGLRGALASHSRSPCPRVPERGAIIITAFIVVAFSILVQGLTMPWLIKRFGLVAKWRRRCGCRCLEPTLGGAGEFPPRTAPNPRLSLLLGGPAGSDDRADGDGHRHRLAGLRHRRAQTWVSRTPRSSSGSSASPSSFRCSLLTLIAGWTADRVDRRWIARAVGGA